MNTNKFISIDTKISHLIRLSPPIEIPSDVADVGNFFGELFENDFLKMSKQFGVDIDRIAESHIKTPDFKIVLDDNSFAYVELKCRTPITKDNRIMYNSIISEGEYLDNRGIYEWMMSYSSHINKANSQFSEYVKDNSPTILILGDYGSGYNLDTYVLVNQIINGTININVETLEVTCSNRYDSSKIKNIKYFGTFNNKSLVLFENVHCNFNKLSQCSGIVIIEPFDENEWEGYIIEPQGNVEYFHQIFKTYSYRRKCEKV